MYFRSIKLTSDGYVHFKGVWGKRYIADKNVFASVLENDKNYCFCPGSIKKLTHVNGCLKSGILDLSSCQGKFVFTKSVLTTSYSLKKHISQRGIGGAGEVGEKISIILSSI